MPRTRGMLGPGAARMGGMRMRPPRPSTPFAGGTTGGAIPMSGPRAAPSAAMPSPGGGGGGGMPMGIKKGGEVKHHKHAKGGEVEKHKKEEHKDEKQDRNLFHKMMREKHHAKGGEVEHESKERREEEHEKKERRHEKLAKGGIVGGADSRTHRPHSGKVC